MLCNNYASQSHFHFQPLSCLRAEASLRANACLQPSARYRTEARHEDRSLAREQHLVLSEAVFPQLRLRRRSETQPLTGLGAAWRLLQSAERHPEPTGLAPGGRERQAVALPRGHFQPAGPFRQGAVSPVPRVSRCPRRRVPCPWAA